LAYSPAPRRSPSCPLRLSLPASKSILSSRRSSAITRRGAHSCPRIDECVAKNEGREITEADEAAWTAANEAEEEAFEALITLSPITMPGLRAAVHYFIEFEAKCISGATDKFLTALLASPLLSIGRA
jgi:hypothetical protein